GEDFVNGTLGVVPRFLWKDKPAAIAPGVWFRQVYQPQKINGWPMGAAALWYLNFGWPGLLTGGLLTGLALGVIAAGQRRRPANGFNTSVAVVIAIYVLGLGWDSETIMRSILWLLPLWLVVRYVAPAPRRTPPRRRRGAAHDGGRRGVSRYLYRRRTEGRHDLLGRVARATRRRSRLCAQRAVL